MTTMLLSTVALQTQNADDDFWARRLLAAYFTSINTLLAVPMPPPLPTTIGEPARYSIIVDNAQYRFIDVSSKALTALLPYCIIDVRGGGRSGDGAVVQVHCCFCFGGARWWWRTTDEVPIILCGSAYLTISHHSLNNNSSQRH